MLRQIKISDLCNELEEKLIELQYSEYSMQEYHKVFREFMEYAGDCDYSNSEALSHPENILRMRCITSG